MTRRNTFLSITAGTLALSIGIAGYCLVQRPASATSASAKHVTRPPACRLAPGQELGFALHTTSVGQKPEDPEPERASLDSEMWWRVVEEDGSGWIVAATLDQVEVFGMAADPMLETPFLLRVGRDCAFRELAFDPVQQDQTRKTLTGLVRGMEFILSPVPGAQWVSRHRDAVGAYDATYTVMAEPAKSGVVISRQRTRYDRKSLPSLPPALGGKLRVDVLASTARAVVDSEGRWLRSLEASDTLRIRAGQRVMTELTTDLGIALLESGKAPGRLAGVNTDRFAWGAPAATVTASVPEVPPVDPALAALDVDGALADFAAFLGDPSHTDGLRMATGRLAGYLRAHPEVLDKILGRVRAGSLDERLHAPLFLAFEKAGTAAAARALEKALADSGMAEADRMRAAAALQDIPRPTERTAGALIEQARAGQSSAAEKPVADAALLALGALSRNARDSRPEVAALAHDYLAQSIQAGAPGDIAVALDAVGNSGNADFAEAVAPYLDDSSPLLRTRAALAYRGMDRAVMEPVLVEHLASESDPVVRRAIGESLLERFTTDNVPASPAVVAAAAARLAAGEPDARARGALIALLGSAAATDAGAKAALVAQFKRETVVDLKVLIGQFVGAADLR